MKNEKTRQIDSKKPFFWHLFLNNQIVTGLVILLLILVVIFAFMQISYIFEPIGAIIDLFIFPTVTSAILFYLFAPLVNNLYEQGINKSITVFAIFIFLILALALSIGSIIPIIRTQVTLFIENIPRYYDTLINMSKDFPLNSNQFLKNLSINFQQTLEGFSIENFTQRLDPIVSSTFGSIGNIVGTVTSAVTGLLTIPIFTYYLLVSADQIPKAILYYVPTKYRTMVSRIMYQGNYQVSQYIRGQIIVAICVAIMFAILYAIIGLEYGTTLAVTAGILNIIPYLGSFIAIIPALIVGLITSPMMLIKVIIVLMIEQTIEGRFISPQVLGNSLKIHPVTILIVLLGSGRLFGVIGVIIGVPVYAVIRVVMTELYRWHRESTTIYDQIDGEEDLFFTPELKPREKLVSESEGQLDEQD